MAFPLDRHFYHRLSAYHAEHAHLSYVRWVLPHNLHVTVLFLGSVSEEAITSIKHRVQAILTSQKPFSLVLKGVTYAPPHRPANMIWAQFKPHERFDAMVEAIADLIEPYLSVQGRKKRRIPHCTLGRFKGRVPKRPLPRLRMTGLEGKKMAVKNIVLYESRLRGSGPRYKEISSFTVLAA